MINYDIIGYLGMIILLLSIYLLGRNEAKTGWITQIIGDVLLFVYSLLLNLNVFIILEFIFVIVATWNLIKIKKK
jgi:cell shape-determining protein MreC